MAEKVAGGFVHAQLFPSDFFLYIFMNISFCRGDDGGGVEVQFSVTNH